MLKLIMVGFLGLILIGNISVAEAKDCGCAEECKDIEDNSERMACLMNCQLKCDGLSKISSPQNHILCQLAQIK